jgi:hypothetical protein
VSISVMVSLRDRCWYLGVLTKLIDEFYCWLI